ncbi:MAG: single-stranded DNA-binding protein [Propionibacteriaceae bacterium]|nr:single-stranded DNA-binding protein [Propionibacteriaceae bacterium]
MSKQETVAASIRTTVRGNLVADPELRTTPTGVQVCTFTVAENIRKFDSASGQHVDAGAVFYNVSVWRQQAVNAQESLRKGMSVWVEGRFEPRAYISQPDGQPAVARVSNDVQAVTFGVCLDWATAQVTRNPRHDAAPSPQGHVAQGAPVPQPVAPTPAQAAPSARSDPWG